MTDYLLLKNKVEDYFTDLFSRVAVCGPNASDDISNFIDIIIYLTSLSSMMSKSASLECLRNGVQN